MCSNYLSKEEHIYHLLSIALVDLRQASEYATFLAAESGRSLPERGQQRVVRRGITTALVVAYSRPFSKGKKRRQNGPTDGVPAAVPATVLKDLTSEERSFHEWLLRSRRQDFAHSDADASNFQFDYWSEFDVFVGVGRDPQAPFDSHVALRVLSLIEKVALGVAREKNAIEPVVKKKYVEADANLLPKVRMLS